MRLGEPREFDHPRREFGNTRSGNRLVARMQRRKFY